jgi:hypothetical protein
MLFLFLEIVDFFMMTFNMNEIKAMFYSYIMINTKLL